MARLILGHDEALAQWAENRHPELFPLGRPLRCLGIADNEGCTLLAVAVFNNFSAFNVDFSMASVTPRWATRGTIRTILHYPFRQAGKRRMTAVTPEGNRRARTVLEKVGFREEGVHPLAGPDGEAAVSYGLYREVAEGRWLKGCTAPGFPRVPPPPVEAPVIAGEVSWQD